MGPTHPPVIEHRRLRGPDGFPGGDGAPDERIDRLGEGGTGFVRRHLEQADGRLGGCLLPLLRTARLRRLPADAPQAQARNFIAAQPGVDVQLVLKVTILTWCKIKRL